MTTLAANLKAARTRRKLTAEQAAELCGVGRSTWFAYESGSRTPSVDGLLEIAAALETTAAKLLKGVELDKHA